MATRTRAYVDTSAFIAFFDRSDSLNTHFTRLFSDPPSLLTSTLVIAEGHGWFLRRYDPRRAIGFLQFVRALEPLAVIPFEPGDTALAMPLLSKYADQRISLADAHGLLLMKVHRINACWSSDRHLGLTGVPLAL